jgi:ADP-L-glycero-D-manno-heptose 6-epimerase
MQNSDTIVITGAAGFIGSYLAGYLNQHGYENLILVDDFADEAKVANLKGKKKLHKIHREQFFDWCRLHPRSISCIFHLGARTDTTEMDYSVHKKWNLDYSKQVWELCVQEQIPLVYASSAATYGNGEWGYKDDHELAAKLQPLNPYGRSKHEFDLWALEQKHTPPFWAGVKFFNVYGPNEYHKGRMASVIFHAFHQITQTGGMRLFRSHNPDYPDGGQMRDFIYVRDVVRMCTWLMSNKPANGLYNIGTGKARTFVDLARAVFAALELPEQISYIDTPEDIRDKYQYFTEADMSKLQHAGYDRPVHSLEEGIADYVVHYLKNGIYF